jgi:aconitase B
VGGTGAPVFAITMDFALIAPQSTNIAMKTTDFLDIDSSEGKLRAESISK